MMGPRARHKAKGKSESGEELLVLAFSRYLVSKGKIVTGALSFQNFSHFLVYVGSAIVVKNHMWTHFLP